MFDWTEKCKSFFDAIKQYLIEPSILSSPEMGKEPYMYLVVSDYAINIVLFQQALEDEQKPVYYMSKSLVDDKTHYSQVEHATLALLITAKKLCPYFQAY